ncbi:hypothetical protein LJ753_10840 [Arthrobacter sp. zg-Y20]|uniref:hypothetical protein n=1 Tax=unclassified Arthrobacter TaxID=235627 RepID=UPI001D14F1CD|nr:MULTISPECIES: hypothetical protein [unclassified Arthrobacter]MCC3276366.1 hypothetical protein [Arthrobacter sp. zg-Y20]MDK1316525.1 hypothetical protein [Arthrobacter sp. zg.Y20]WIB06566.1 hypothetical protein QNO06_02140 [Arthrobacter sp. zg-Y20]
MGSNGVPQALTPEKFSRDLAELRRLVDRLLSRRPYVSTDRIVEGAPLSEGVSRQLTETVQEKIVVGRDNLPDAVLDDRVLTGSTVQSSPEPDVGSKLTDDGLTSHGQAAVKFGDGTSVRHKVRAQVGKHLTRWSIGADDAQPGFWFESERLDGLSPAAKWPAGFTLGRDDPLAMQGISGAKSEVDAYSTVTFAPAGVGMDAFGTQPGGAPGARRYQSTIYVYDSGFRLASYDLGGAMVSGVSHTADGYLRLTADKGILVNGAPLGAAAKIPSTMATLSGGFTHFAQSGWSGVRYSRSGDIAQVSGAYERGSYGTQEVVGTLPKELWPPSKVKGTNVEINTAGQILTVVAGSGPQSLGITYLL